jgi:hypothetical protein
VQVADKSAEPIENVQVTDRTKQEIILNALAHYHHEHEVWWPGALGKPCLACYGILCEVGEITAVKLAKLVNRRHVRHHLGTLKKYGLATSRKRLWYPIVVPVEYLDRLARELGTSGKASAQRERHAKDRRNFSVWVKAGQPLLSTRRNQRAA